MDITEKVFQSTNVHQLVEQLSKKLQKATIIENKNFELIAYSSPNEFSFDPIQQKTILSKRCPLFIIERLKKEGIIDRLKWEDQPIRLQAIEDIGFYQRIVVSLKYHNIIRGYLWIYEADELLNEEDFALLSKIAPYLGKLLFEEQSIIENDVQTVIWKLLNDEFLNEAEMHQATNKVSYTVPDQFTVLVTSIIETEYLNILEKIKEIFIQEEIGYYLGKGTEIVGIIDGTKHHPASDKVIRIQERIEKTLTKQEQNAVFIGSGKEYSKISQIRKSYLEALEVIETMVFLDVDKLSSTFEELGLFRYLKLMYKKNISEQYRNEKIVKIMKKDAENNSELLKTLWCFIKNNCRVGKTAEQLFIHPNTLNYRIKQITELTAIDFGNVHERAELYFQLIALHYIPDYYEFYRKQFY
ncbi:helix-turn-helix domain-containing protein [Pseudogracilibacillus sp. SE30717A]|uniref:PucR family transcriptional regulator n=1 Tax=Pseudogracilibacillus sp. SE30717A TaxID=3098293 RepID=UPI00300E0CF7